MEALTYFIDLFLHLDKHLNEVVQNFGIWSYVILFVIVFCETGLVVTPILPGDSLLFAAGTLAALGSFNVHILALTLFIAAVLGDAVNYMVGAYIGPKVFQKKDSKIFRPEYLERTQRFYDRYGGKAIVIARFVPIVRTFAPFLAGVGEMSYAKFALYNVAGAALWIGTILYAGYFFGTIDIVKRNFSIVVMVIIVVSLLPVLFEVVRSRREARTEG